MKACVLENIGNLVYKNVPQPEIEDHEVLLKIKACGICSSDVPRVFKSGTYHFPTIPGHEFAGEIVKVGAKVSTNLIGKYAAVFPLLPCFECDNCVHEQYARCNHYNYFGSRCDGGFAEYIAVPEWNLVMIDNNLNIKTAALCEPAAVARHSVKTCGEIEGKSFLVVGTGTIGILAALWAKEYGANVTLLARNERKKKFLIEKMHLNTQDDFPKKEYDFVLECVGTVNSLEQAINYTKKGGTIILTGNPLSDMNLSKNVYWKILRNELVIRGTWNSSYSSIENDWIDAISFLKRNEVTIQNLITQTFQLSQSKQAFQTLMDPEQFTIKVMFTM